MKKEKEFWPAGISLIEIMVAMLIFAFTIGLGSKFVTSGAKSDFLFYPPEIQRNFHVQIESALQALPSNHPLLTSGLHTNPFPDIPLPHSVVLLTMEWGIEVPGTFGKAVFTSTSDKKSKWRWYCYKKLGNEFGK